ncbi:MULTISPECIES: amino acid ABC transporter permease [unclassified Gilliamella]|uniref:amino acid ABC transporter permease n=1 Tax=unclassified Gilliamella TaxID=2685620 RepID=UPI00080EC038|nr:amino acid ABC transporter permease [Gilliamella apicola]OCG18810.1 ABC transporter permease [Gilliamella apicola]OCG20836.1 ABC transporter permease [Gilliamella apicola]
MEIKGLAVIYNNLSYMMWGNFPGGIFLTLLMSFAAIIVSTLLGILAGVGLTVLKGTVRYLLVSILGFLRAIPVIMLIFWTYFLLPVLLNVDVPAIATVICALSLIGAAYIGHSVHAGMIAVAKDQWQAAFSLGLTKKQVILFIILPQALKMMLPSFVNQWVSLIKDTSLAYIVGVAEFTFIATQVNNRSMVYPTEIFLFVIVVYFIICASLDFAVSILSKLRLFCY